MCGLSLAECQYKGRHPQPKCSTCGKELAQCQYKGKHPQPKCSTCGKDLTECQYEGEHPKPKCSTCGKDLTECQYEGEHPKPTTGTVNGHEWVDLGLSVKWATCNVGASNPSSYGGYYAWGETRTKSNYNWSNCFDCLDSEGKNWGTYYIGGQTQITPSSGHDTARENWGGTWRMPTVTECDELCMDCQWTWTNKDGHNGYVVTGPNGNSIFLPATGWRCGTTYGDVGEYGNYWSSTLSSSYLDYARCLYFDSSGHNTSSGDRRSGRSVRPVTE